MIADILKEIDAEIARLQKVRDLLGPGNSATKQSASLRAAAPARKRRRLSAEARKRIAEAQKRRWAKAKGKTPA